jgi:uncharacterized membrane-anchored protein
MNQEPPPLADETGVASTTWRGLPRSLVVVALAVGVVFGLIAVLFVWILSRVIPW